MTAPSLFGKCTRKDLAKRAVPHMGNWPTLENCAFGCACPHSCAENQEEVKMKGLDALKLFIRVVPFW